MDIDAIRQAEGARILALRHQYERGTVEVRPAADGMGFSYVGRDSAGQEIWRYPKQKAPPPPNGPRTGALVDVSA